MNRWHIRWYGGKLDWECFGTREEAEASAKQLAKPNETYSIEECDGTCPMSVESHQTSEQSRRSKSEPNRSTACD
jgi:hypothetical protein